MASLLAAIEHWEWDPPNTPLSTWHAPAVGTVLYLAMIPLLKLYMKDKERYKLVTFQVVYNVVLVTLSVAMMVSMVFFACQRYQTLGIWSLLCEDTDRPFSGGFGFTIYVFYLSKYLELLDTVQLILTKKPVILLHLTHHMMMLTIPWSWLSGGWIVGSWWCVFVNSLVHSFMYYYYLRASLGVHLWWKRGLTVGQIIQFFSGFFLVSYWFWIRTERGCRGGLFTAWLSHIANGFMICMFIKFFVDTYIRGKDKAKDKAKKEN